MRAPTATRVPRSQETIALGRLRSAAPSDGDSRQPASQSTHQVHVAAPCATGSARAGNLMQADRGAMRSTVCLSIVLAACGGPPPIRADGGLDLDSGRADSGSSSIDAQL